LPVIANYPGDSRLAFVGHLPVSLSHV
jgi:hypothetical protein